jgi:hypothetical protein
MDDCHQGRHHKIDEETKKLAIPTTMNAFFTKHFEGEKKILVQI